MVKTRVILKCERFFGILNVLILLFNNNQESCFSGVDSGANLAKKWWLGTMGPDSGPSFNKDKLSLFFLIRWGKFGGGGAVGEGCGRCAPAAGGRKPRARVYFRKRENTADKFTAMVMKKWFRVVLPTNLKVLLWAKQHLGDLSSKISHWQKLGVSFFKLLGFNCSVLASQRLLCIFSK